jgi:uncharacterized protein YecT (DUF1311 family)
MSVARVLRCGVVCFAVGLALRPGSAPAFDCAKASTAIEKAICSDTALVALEERMTQAYGEVRKALKPKERAALLESQRKWLASRDQCEDVTVEKTGACVREKTEERRALLAGEPVSGPGTGSRMIPMFIQQEGSKTQYAVDFNLIRFARPKSKAEKLFNAEVDKLADTAPMGPHGEDLDLEIPLESIAGMTVGYASPRLLSAEIVRWSFDGGAHGNGSTSHINIDLKRGAFLASEDIFASEARVALKDECKTQIIRQKGEGASMPYNPAEDPSFSEDTIMQAMNGLDHWQFFSDRAVVTFDPYEIGAMSRGPMSASSQWRNSSRWPSPTRCCRSDVSSRLAGRVWLTVEQGGSGTVKPSAPRAGGTCHVRGPLLHHLPRRGSSRRRGSCHQGTREPAAADRRTPSCRDPAGGSCDQLECDARTSRRQGRAPQPPRRGTA